VIVHSKLSGELTFANSCRQYYVKRMERGGPAQRSAQVYTYIHIYVCIMECGGPAEGIYIYVYIYVYI